MRPLVAVLILAGPAVAAEPSFKAGFAERDITPDIGMEAPGGYGKAYHKKLHDPCKVRAAVFDDGSSVVALVGVDTLAIRRPTIDAARKAITAKTGIPASAILIGASHSHAGGPASMILPKEYDHASDEVKQLAYEKSSCADPKYLEKLESALAEAVIAAHAGRVPVTAGIGRGKAEGVAYNRRFKMRDGSTFTHPGQGNPDIVEPAGPTDPEVGVIGAWNSEGKLLGCVVNFACHATTGPGGISADYIYYVEKVLQGYFGKECVVVFLNGASGDITQVDNRNPTKQPTGDEWAQRVGGTVGAEALKVLLRVDRGNLGPVAGKAEILTFKRRVPSEEKVKRAWEILRQDPAKVDRSEWTFAKETVLLDASLKAHPTAEAEVQAVQVGPAVFLTTPAEYFCQFGLDQKAKSGFPYTFPVSLANGCVGYVPTEEAFSPTGGGYETRLTSYSNLEITAGNTMRDKGIALAKTFQPGPIPARPKPLPFAKPWSYGNNKPEVR